MDETVRLVVTAVTELVPQHIVAGMVTVLFVVTLGAIAILEISLAMLVGNISSLIDRILPAKKDSKLPSQVVVDSSPQWLKKLVFWKKVS